MALGANDNAVSSTDRIKQLNEIDHDVVKLLQSAGSALEALTTFEGSSSEKADRPTSIEHQKEQFTAASSQYLTLLSSIDVRLRHQINALQDAEIIPAESAARNPHGSLAATSTFSNMGGPLAQSKQTGGNRSAVTGGGLGSLDVGWLNSRNDHIGKGMEAELWEEAQKFLEKSKSGHESRIKTAGKVNGQTIPEMPPDVDLEHQESLMDQT